MKKKIKGLYLLRVKDDYCTGSFDYYDSCVVVAKSKEEAVMIDPTGGLNMRDKYDHSWAGPENIIAEWIGSCRFSKKLNVGDVVIASYNA